MQKRNKKTRIVVIVCGLAMLLPIVAKANDTIRVQKRRTLPKTALVLDYERGTIGDYDRLRAVLTVPFFHARYLTLSASGRYNLIDQDFSGKVSYFNADEINLNGTHHVFTGGVSAYSRFKVGGCLVNLFGHAMVDFSQWGYENIVGILAGVVMLKESQEEAFGIGIVGLIHSASSWPVFPAITWRRQLSRQLMLDITLPKVGVHYYANSAMKCSAGMTFDVDRFYFRPGVEGMRKTCRYSRAVLKFGGTWEWKPTSAVMLHVGAGTAVKVKSEVSTRDGRDEYFKVKQPVGFYFNLGTAISL